MQRFAVFSFIGEHRQKSADKNISAALRLGG
jgi:hypothetical protein